MRENGPSLCSFLYCILYGPIYYFSRNPRFCGVKIPQSSPQTTLPPWFFICLGYRGGQVCLVLALLSRLSCLILSSSDLGKSSGSSTNLKHPLHRCCIGFLLPIWECELCGCWQPNKSYPIDKRSRCRKTRSSVFFSSTLSCYIQFDR